MRILHIPHTRNLEGIRGSGLLLSKSESRSGHREHCSPTLRMTEGIAVAADILSCSYCVDIVEYLLYRRRISISIF